LFTVRIQAEDFDAAVESAKLTRGHPEVGAIVTFSGLCRAENKPGEAPLVALTLEHYPGMAEREIERIMKDARARWPLIGATVIHRFGRMLPGDNIVLVVTASSHRGSAFAAAEFLMDWLKTRAPFWKLEEQGEARSWVGAKDEDDDAASRWVPTRPTP